MSIYITESREIKKFGKPYVIAEIGANHNGDMVLARNMIEAAKRAGADCVKFQSWSVDSVNSAGVYNDNYFLNDDYRNRSDTDLRSIVKRYAITEQQLLEMKRFCDELKIDCVSTPFSESEIDFLVDELRVPFVKIASMDLNNYPLLAYFAKKNVPLIISVGLSELYEIDKAIRTIEQNGCRKIVILHCVSIYPPADHEVNLRNINTLAQMYPDYQIGFSDHSLGINLPIASVALGVPIIEKHFTLDKTLPGWDHKVSADEGELRQICEGALQVYQSMGSNRIVAVEDEERRNAFRRSLVLKCNLKKGEKISRDNLTAKRPGDGLKPEMIEFVVGRTVAHDMEANSILYLTDII